ncbi:hypothetical protein H0H93_010218 [Arthromyces matolae]|nr:hypothetical protein H0H93_010218 [Arthromyces matolae]
MLVDLATTVPAPLTVALVPLAPLLAVARRALQVASWKSSWYDACLAIALWWAFCLLAEPTLRCMFPIFLAAVLCLPICLGQPKTTATEQTLQNTLSDLTIINSLLPKPWVIPPASTLFRVAAIVYVPYLIIIRFVPLRVIFAVAGTAVLAARAPFIVLIISILSRSAYLRHTYRCCFSILTGTPLPEPIMSYHPTSTSLVPVPSLRFIFTIYENQRWWMGLDWTAALLPGERPSWCSPPPSHAPVSPPNVFTLPRPTTVFLSDGNGHRIKRTALWRWEEPEWRVMVCREHGTVSRVERPIPEDTSDDHANESTGARLLKAAGKMRESSAAANTNNTSAPNPNLEDAPEDYQEEDNIATDLDGWIYGDNKWEGPSSKGGLSKVIYIHNVLMAEIFMGHGSILAIVAGPALQSSLKQ